MLDKVLVVDDEEDYLNVMMLHLKRRGYEVLGAPNPFLALDIIEKQGSGISILVTDWMMPGNFLREINISHLIIFMCPNKLLLFWHFSFYPCIFSGQIYSHIAIGFTRTHDFRNGRKILVE